MKGYWKNEKATKESFDKNGYYKTGDMAMIDENGYIFIKERLKELIKVKSFQVIFIHSIQNTPNILLGSPSRS